MNLIFYDRRTVPVQPASEALLTIERGGNFSFSIAAVAGLKLKAADEVVLAKDADTNIWYVVLQPKAGFESFKLNPRDKGGRALMFCAKAQAVAYYGAHELNAETNKSVRTLVGLAPMQHSGMELYPLTPQHPTKAPAAAAAPSAPAEVASQPDVAPLPSDLPYLQAPQPAAPAAEAASEAAPVAAASKYTAEQDAALLDMTNSPSDLAREWGVSAAALHTRRGWLKRKAGEPVTAAPVPPAAPTTPTLVYTPAPADGVAQAPKTFGLQARAQELTSYWMERDISNTTPGELAEILNLMRHIPEGKRGIEMTLVLDRAETEQTHRLTAAGKGGRRG